MIDIHCHILPDMDDGATDLEVSLGMCRAAAAEGITHVVATPHCNHQFPFDPEAVASARDQLQQACGPQPKLLTGCDFHLSAENLELLQADPSRYTIAQKNHLLLEPTDYGLPPHFEQLLFQMRCRGIIPVLTHPERNPLFQSKPDLVGELAHQECVIQVTAGALLGRFGMTAQKTALNLLRRGLVHVVASDAHNLAGRPLSLRGAFDKVAQEAGAATAELLFEENPRNAIEGGTCRSPEPISTKPRWSFFRR